MARKGVVVCGANGERGLMLEKAIERFSPKNSSKIIQFSVCTVGTSPIMIQMSGVDMDGLIAVSGCRNRCCERIMEKNGLHISKAVVLDDCTSRTLGPCQPTSVWDFPNIKDEEIDSFVKLMEKALE